MKKDEQRRKNMIVWWHVIIQFLCGQFKNVDWPYECAFNRINLKVGKFEQKTSGHLFPAAEELLQNSYLDKVRRFLIALLKKNANLGGCTLNSIIARRDWLSEKKQHPGDKGEESARNADI